MADDSLRSPGVSSISSGHGGQDDHESLLIKQEEIHSPIPVVPALYGMLLLLIVLPAGGFLIPVLYVSEGKTDAFSVLQYLHVIIWALMMVLTWYVKAEHKKSCILGYYEFYYRTRHLHRLAYYILGAANALLVVVGNLINDYCLEDSTASCSVSISLSSVNYQQIIFIFEIILCMPFVIKHIVEVVRFNAAERPPDTVADDMRFRFSRPDSYVGVGGTSNMELLLEHQADLLRDLKHRNSVLAEQLYHLSQLQRPVTT